MRQSEICVPIAYENIIYGVIDCEHPKNIEIIDKIEDGKPLGAKVIIKIPIDHF